MQAKKIMQIKAVYEEESSQVYYENLSQKHHFEWNAIHLLTRLVTVDVIMRAFR